MRVRRSNSWGRQVALLAIGPGLLACGTQSNNEIPEELLAAIRAGEGQNNEYPAGPYGSKPGDVAPNICMAAWRDPSMASAEADLEEVCFADYWDPEGSRHALLLVNTAATWCGACQVEYGGGAGRPTLSSEVQKRHEAGLRVYGSIFQDAARDPANAQTAVAWTKAFSVDFVFGVDEQFQMGAFADPNVQPFNMLIDTRTMEIVFQLQGDVPTTLWPTIDEFLAQK